MSLLSCNGESAISIRIMEKLVVIFCFLVALCGRLEAQTVITGKVIDTQGRTVDAYVTVSLKGKNSILGYAGTDGKGYYKLEFKAQGDSLVVTVAGLAIGQQARVVANRTQQLDFHVKNKGIKLKEISVRAPKISEHGDTLNYNVTSYQQQGDRVIADVLKRMPGIEVSNNGAIKFNGKSISKFYVEDMDLLQGRYGLATNNVNAQDVATVQVLQNHQSVKALQGRVFTDEVAINLKLKNSAKGTMAVNTMLGAGGQMSDGWGIGTTPLSDGMTAIGRNPLWTTELVGMYFAKQRQNMTLYKGNNTGDDVSKELIQHYSSINGVGLNAFCPMNAVMPSGSGLPQKRSFDNHSHILTTNHLEKLGKDSELSLNVAYHNDRIRREGKSDVDRFISEDQRLLSSETLVSQTNQNNLSTNLRYCRNAANAFTANVFQFDGGWNDDNVSGQLSSGLMGEYPMEYGDNRVSQHFHRPSFSVSNTLNTIRNFGKHTLDLNFSAGYAQSPNTLMVDVDSLQQGTAVRYQQDLTSHNIAGNIHTSYSLHLGSFSLHYGVVAHASLHGIRTDLDGFVPPVEEASLQNDLWYNTYELALSQLYKFEKSGWRLSLGCPLNLYTQTLDDRIRRDRQSYTHLLVSPSVSASYEWLDWSGNVSASYYRSVGDPSGIYSGYIMNNYRSFQRSYVEQLSETDRMNAGATLAYRSALYATFFRINANYTHTRDNQIYDYDYQGATSVVQAVDQETSSDRYSLGFDGSKGFDWLQTSIRAFAGYSYSQSERLIAKELYPFHAQTVSIGAGGTITPWPWFNIVVSSGYAWNVSATDRSNEDLAQTVRTATQRIKLNFYITKQLTFTASAEDNYNNLTEKNRHAWFGDLSAKYKLKHVDLELQANNLFNQKQYTRVNYSGLDIFTSTSQLRPLNVILTLRFKLL